MSSQKRRRPVEQNVKVVTETPKERAQYLDQLAQVAGDRGWDINPEDGTMKVVDPLLRNCPGWGWDDNLRPDPERVRLVIERINVLWDRVMCGYNELLRTDPVLKEFSDYLETLPRVQSQER